MRAFQQLSDTQRSIFREQLSPVLGEETVEIIGRGSEALPRITQQVDAMLMSRKGIDGCSRRRGRNHVERECGNELESPEPTHSESCKNNLLNRLRGKSTCYRGNGSLTSFQRYQADESVTFFTGIRDEVYSSNSDASGQR